MAGLLILAHCAVFAPEARAALIGGVDFPQGAISFADEVVSYSPIFVSGNPDLPYRGAANALGIPDYTSGSSCASQAACSWVSLGDGGNLVLRFVDNVLTGSGSTAPDLWVFEIGTQLEDTFVEISVDGITWLPVGKVTGSTQGVDIDAFGFGPGSLFPYVRLTDDPAEGGQSGDTVGADIDAVGAITTLPVTSAVPEPGTSALLAAGLAAVYLRKRK